MSGGNLHVYGGKWNTWLTPMPKVTTKYRNAIDYLHGLLAYIKHFKGENEMQ